MKERAESHPTSPPPRWGRLRVACAFGALCLVWGMAFVVLRIGLREAPPLTFTALRAFVGGVALAACLLANGRPLPLDRSTQITAVVMGTANVAGFWGLQSLAILRITPGEAAILVYVQPLLVALGAWLILDERLSLLAALGLLAGFAGVVLVIGGQALLQPHSSWVGYLCALGGALCWAIGTIYFKARPAAQSLLWIAALQAIYGSLPLAMLALAVEHPRVVLTLTLFWTVAYAGFGASALAYVLWFSLLRQHAASRVAAFVFLVPLVAVVGDSVVLGDRFGPSAVIGGALIVLGIWLVNRQQSASMHKVRTAKFVQLNDRQ
ncbi:MAG TPA: DMT family transporter [Chloroflexota bacterium]|nr:DMT family transporter [Chloroflexota bacterium]